MKNKIIAQDKEHLQSLIKQKINLHGQQCRLNHIDTAKITDMSYLFIDSKFNGHISDWNVSNVKDMQHMFAHSQFNQDISSWDVSHVIDMYAIFYQSKFNQDISQWNTFNVTDMTHMFDNSQFNGDINQWDVSNVNDMTDIFKDSECEKPWWAIEDNKKRQIAITHYQLMQQLNNKLIDKEEILNFKRSKI